MRDEPLVIAQVVPTSEGGGAEAVARTLLRGLQGRGHEVHLLAGRGAAEGPHEHTFPADAAVRLAHLASGPGRVIDRWRGLETYRYPKTRRMLEVLPRTPDLVHLHNLHGGYFDLRVLPELGRSVPVAVTLHDAWLLSGHCAHSMGCDRWRTGCGECPDLGIYPAVRVDATAANWRRKRDILGRSRLYVATPSAWLADRVRASIVAPAVQDLRVIPNGVDLEVFRPGGRASARRAHGLDADRPVLLFVAGRTPDNPFKDRGTAETAAVRAAERLGEGLTLVVLGGKGPDRTLGHLDIRQASFTNDPAEVADWYRAADVYVHAARADTFPSTVLEALACGTPVVASAVGGIPEQVRGLDLSDAGSREGRAPEREAETGAGPRPTGILVAPGDADAMAGALVHVLTDEERRSRLAANAARDAAERFDANRQVRAYEAWYREILSRERGDA